MTHANAPLIPGGRHRLAVCIVKLLRRAGGRGSQVAPDTAKRWADRHRAGLPMTDRSSHPHRSPNQLVQRTSGASSLFVSTAAGVPPGRLPPGPVDCLRATRKAAGLSHIRLHDLRQFYVSGLIASGCDVVTVQRALGHELVTTTLAAYAHLWPRAEDRTRSAAVDLMRSTLVDDLADFCGLGSA